MGMNNTLVGEVLELERIPVEIDLDAEYKQIGVKSFGKGIFHRDPCLGSELSKLRYFEIHPNRLVVSNIMAWEGAIAISGDSESGFVGSARFLSYYPKYDDDIRYLNYYFQSTAGQDLVRSASTGTVTRNQTLSPKNFEKCVIPLPDPKEQRLIADSLDRSFERIDRVRALRDRSHLIAQQHMDLLFGSISQSAPLSEALILNQDTVDVDPNETYQIAGVYSFGRGLIQRPIISGSETAYKKFGRVRTGQVVMSKLGAWEGALAVADDNFDNSYLSPEYPIFDINIERADHSYIRYLTRWPGLWSRLTTRGSMARRKRTTPAKLLSTEVPLPNMSEQRDIARQIDLVQRSSSPAQNQRETLDALRESLLNAAFPDQL